LELDIGQKVLQDFDEVSAKLHKAEENNLKYL